MPETANDRKVAVLLTSLGGDAIASTFATLSDDRADAVRRALDEMEDNPPSETEREEVLDDFEKFFRFALETAHMPPTWMQDLLDNKANASAKDRGSENMEDDDELDDELPPPRQPTLKIFHPSDDPYYDLRRLKPVQLAGALRFEQPKTIALVMNHLSKEQTAEVIENLPEKLQAAVILEIGNKPTVPQFLLDRMVVETVRMASSTSNDVAKEPDINDQLAQMLRGMPKKNRTRIMDEIRDTDPDTAVAISARLYIFEDIVKYDDRSIQKLLREVESATLTAALQDADDAIRDTIFNNLSKRARSAMMEELDLSPKLAPDDVLQARENVATAIGRLDQEGQLNTR